MKSYSPIMFALVVGFIVIQALLVNYLVKLERTGCECAMDWRRKYIIFYLIYTIIYAFLTFILDPEDLPLIQTMMVVLGILDVIFVLQYVHRLKKQKCNCSESIYRDILTIVAIVNAFLYSLMFIMIIYMMYVLASFARSSRGKQLLGKVQKLQGEKNISIKPLKNTTKKSIAKLFLNKL